MTGSVIESKADGSVVQVQAPPTDRAPQGGFRALDSSVSSTSSASSLDDRALFTQLAQELDPDTRQRALDQFAVAEQIAQLKNELLGTAVLLLHIDNVVADDRTAPTRGQLPFAEGDDEIDAARIYYKPHGQLSGREPVIDEFVRSEILSSPDRHKQFLTRHFLALKALVINERRAREMR